MALVVSRAAEFFLAEMRFALDGRSDISLAMSNRKKTLAAHTNEGYFAESDGVTLRSWNVGSLPIVNRILAEMRLEEILQTHLPPDGPRMKIPTSRGLMLLVRNILLSREPVYGLSEWAQRHAPDLIEIPSSKMKHLNDDRLGRCLDRLFAGIDRALIMELVKHVIGHFGLSLEELHNDSTTVTFHGAYDDALVPGLRQGLPTLGITWGHNKDHRPDLKQLLYILTVTDDGGVPVYFTTASGNTTDDRTHLETWELLRELTGRVDFLYVADCKLASSKNLKAIDRRGGRFITVLPRTRREDKQFRQRLLDQTNVIRWTDLYQEVNDDGEVVDHLRVASETFRTSDGFRLLWFDSLRKSQQDAATRLRQLNKLQQELDDLQRRLQSPKTRFRTRRKVEEALEKVLAASTVSDFVRVEIEEHEKETFKQTSRGRPSKNTQYTRRVETRYRLVVKPNTDAVLKATQSDGKFPLITNQDDMSAEEVLQAYKRQPLVEKRFSQFKHDFEVAPVFLKSVSRIQALLAVYFFVLVAQTLLERELRRAMEAHQIEDLPLYPEGRSCSAPTTKRIVDLFEPIQRHELKQNGGRQVFVTKLSSVHRSLLKLLGMSPRQYGK
jgi:transposase